MQQDLTKANLNPVVMELVGGGGTAFSFLFLSNLDGHLLR